VLIIADIQISIDGKGRSMGNVFIERLWRSLMYECVYLHAFEIGLTLHAGLEQWISNYNTRRTHSTLAGRTSERATIRVIYRQTLNMPSLRCRAANRRRNWNQGTAWPCRQPVQPNGATLHIIINLSSGARQVGAELLPMRQRPSRKPTAKSAS
jgi:hypothetical protein